MFQTPQKTVQKSKPKRRLHARRMKSEQLSPRQKRIFKQVQSPPNAKSHKKLGGKKNLGATQGNSSQRQLKRRRKRPRHSKHQQHLGSRENLQDSSANNSIRMIDRSQEWKEIYLPDEIQNSGNGSVSPKPRHRKSSSTILGENTA